MGGKPIARNSKHLVSSGMQLLAFLSRHRSLRMLWLGEIISQAGDSLFQLALIWLVLSLTGSSSLTGLVAMSAYLPVLILGLPAGALVDRLDRRRVMLGAIAARALLAGTIPLLAFRGLLDPLLLGAITFAMAVFSAHFSPARDALVPELVPPAELRPANALIQSGWQLALLAGPGLAGLLTPLTGELHLFTATALAYLLSAGFIASMPATHKGQGRTAGRLQLSHELRQAMAKAGEGLALARRDRRLWAILLVTGADNLFIMGPAIVGTPLFVKQVLHGSSGDYAYLLTAYAVGMICGSLALARWGKQLRDSRLLLWGIVLDGITFLPLLWVSSFAGAWLTLFIHSLMIPLIVVPRPTLIQRMVPAEFHGRVFAMVSVAVTGLSAVSVALTGLVAEWVPVPWIFGSIAVLGALCGLAGWTIREFRDA
jgi:DHA3 family macrolide efflux protein-like MFS transporter